MRPSRKLAVGFGFVLCFCLSAVADVRADGPPPGGTLGISATVQSDQYELLLPYWLDDKTTVLPVVRVVHIGDAGTDIGIGLVVRYHLRTENAAPFVGVRGMALIDSPKRGDAATDVLLGGLVGGEYFLDPHFSLAVEAQVNVAISSEKSLRFGNPGGTNINTATGIFAAFYF